MNKKRLTKNKDYSALCADKKTFFSEKEIIFRSRGRAKVFTLSSRLQVFVLALLFFLAAGSYYSYHLYDISGSIISDKDKELDETRDAYVNLMSDVLALHKKIGDVVDAGGKKNAGARELKEYKRQALLLEDKFKQLTVEKAWASDDKINEKMTLSEAILQRDIAASERDELKKQMKAMESIIDDIKAAEMEVLEKVEAISSREVGKIKSAFTSINVPLKKKGLYFNALANKKKNAKGGTYIQAPQTKLEDKRLNAKISKIYKDLEDLNYYREVVKYVPMGKPVWSYWLTSQYGTRSDPFNGRRASHKGVDLASRTGNIIKVKAHGKVTRAEYTSGYGNLIVIDHGNGFQTKYGHLNKIYVKKGQRVTFDQEIGEVGSTGRSTGPHLHYEVLFNGKDVDPLPFIKAKIS